MDNMIVWADIPVSDLERAMEFYGAVTQHPFMTMDGMPGIALPAPEQPAVGAPEGGPHGPMPALFDLYVSEKHQPGDGGVTIYLESHGDPWAMLKRAQEAGGEILEEVADRGPMVGFIGFFRDTEGNRIGVHRAHER